ncbi:MAG TPA: helix-turn-helix domain-containing protein, partial [Actinomycetes bacterium]|nr:helix-turn-helix domain-containing protein [Actinomycetes bacterium]
MTRVEAVAKAARVLQAFTPLVTSLSLRQLADRTGIPRSTAHAICVTLCDAGLLEEVPGRGYRLGPALVGLGGQVIERTGLVGAAEGVLERLAPGDGLEIHLGQLVGGWVVYLDRASGPVRAPMRNRVGLRAPAHLTGCGKAALALLPPDEVAARVREVCAAEPGHPPDLDALARELAAAPTAAVYGRIGTCTVEFGTLTSWLVDVVNVLTGNLDRPGGAMFPKPATEFAVRRRPYQVGRW